jgi:hypothetical protein
VRKRREAADVINAAIKNRTPSFAKSVHEFMSKVVLCQRWVRAFLQCQEARLQLLWRVMERAERRRQDGLRQERFRKEKEAHDLLRACRGDYVSTAISIDAVAHKTSKLIAERQLRVRRIKRVMRVAEAVVQAASGIEESHSHTVTSAVPPRSWVQRALSAGPGAVHRLRILRKVLRHQRRMHISRFEATRSRRASQRTVPVIALSDVREFLRDVTGRYQIQLRIEDGRAQGLLSSVFSLLTGGAVTEVADLVNTGKFTLASALKKKASHESAG